MKQSPKVEKAMVAARKRVASFDAIDLRCGVCPPHGRELILAAIEAIKAGIATDDWDCAADAAVMLERFL